jgi:hypothetical protein
VPTSSTSETTGVTPATQLAMSVVT